MNPSELALARAAIAAEVQARADRVQLLHTLQPNLAKVQRTAGSLIEVEAEIAGLNASMERVSRDLDRAEARIATLPKSGMARVRRAVAELRTGIADKASLDDLLQRIKFLEDFPPTRQPWMDK